MAILRGVPRFKRGPSFRGRIMIDTFRGVLRVRKWPKKRGRPRSAKQRFWVDWFVQANRLAKYADGMSLARAIEMTKGSGLYPRDVLLMAMRGRLYTWSTPDGWRWYSMAAKGDISESFDILAQTVGSVLVRAVDLWRPPPPGALNDVLTYKGNLTSPVWQAPGGGVSQALIPGTPIACDDTVSEYVLDITGQAEAKIILKDVDFATTDRPLFRFSIDGGATYKAGATDYTEMLIEAQSDATHNRSFVLCADRNSTSPFQLVASLGNINIDRLTYMVTCGIVSTFAIVRNGSCNFDGPVTHLKIFSLNGSNFKSGTIRGTVF